MAFNIFSKAILEGQPITIFGDGTQTRDFTYVADVVTALRRAFETDAAVGGVFNVGGGSQVGLREAVALLAERAGAEPAVEHVDFQHGDVKDTCADSGLIESTLGFVPSTTLGDGLAAELEWMRDSLSRGTRAVT